MKAYVISEADGPEKLVLTNVDLPDLYAQPRSAGSRSARADQTIATGATSFSEGLD